MLGNRARTIFPFGVSSWPRRSVRSPGLSPPRRTARWKPRAGPTCGGVFLLPAR